MNDRGQKVSIHYVFSLFGIEDIVSNKLIHKCEYVDLMRHIEFMSGKAKGEREEEKPTISKTTSTSC